LRLARFSVFQVDRPDSFAGLPTPAAAVVAASFVLFIGHMEWTVAFWMFGSILLGLAVLMVSIVRYPKWKLQMLTLPPRRPYLFLFLCVLGMVAFQYALERSIAFVLLPLALVYVGYGIVDTAYQALHAAWTGGPAPEEAIDHTAAGEDAPTAAEGDD